MSVETVRMSSKGQVVIPQGIREELNAGEGTVFAVFGTKDKVVLKKIETPSAEELICELEEVARDSRKKLEARGLKEKDIPGFVEKRRR